MRLPDHVFQTLQRVAAKFPGNRPHDDYGLVLNEVAWEHRAEGYGLSEKTGGIRVHHPILGDIAEDVLQLPDGTHWDVFGSAGGGRPIDPKQGDSIVPNTPRKWLAPVQPSGEVIIPAPQPKPEPPVVVVVPPTAPIPVTTCGCRADAILAALSEQAIQIEGLSSTVHQLIAAQTAIHLAEIKEMIAALPQEAGSCRFPTKFSLRKMGTQ